MTPPRESLKADHLEKAAQDFDTLWEAFTSLILHPVGQTRVLAWTLATLSTKALQAIFPRWQVDHRDPVDRLQKIHSYLTCPDNEPISLETLRDRIQVYKDLCANAPNAPTSKAQEAPPPQEDILLVKAIMGLTSAFKASNLPDDGSGLAQLFDSNDHWITLLQSHWPHIAQGTLKVAQALAQAQTQGTWPSGNQLCLTTSLSKTSVHRSLQALENQGWISRHIQKQPSGQGFLPTHYRLLFPHE